MMQKDTTQLIAQISSLATQTELLEYMKKEFDTMIKLCENKNSDYTGGGDAFGNFTAGEFLGIGLSEEGFLWRMTDKFKRIITFVKRGALKVADEKVEDTLRDFANYCILLSAFIHFKRKKHKEKSS